MINHLRTRLMNVNGQVGFRSDVPGEEYVPATARARKLHPSVRHGWETLFGTKPDRLFLNYRLYQLMTLLHEAELASYVTIPDSRLTYWPRRDPGFFEDTWGVSTSQVSGPTTDLYITGEPVGDDSSGRAQWEHTFTAEAGTPGDLSPIVDLGNSLKVRTRYQGTACRWQITARGRPQTDLGQVLANFVTDLGEGLAYIFPEPRVFPYVNLYQIYEQHPITLLRYAACVIALGLRMDDMETA